MKFASQWMILASLFFASMGVCVKQLGNLGMATAVIIFGRGLVGVIATATALQQQKIPFRSLYWRWHLTRSITGAFSLCAYFYSLSVLPLATGITLNYTSPIFVVLILSIGTKERISIQAYAALLLGFIGVCVLLQPSFSQNQLHAALIGLGSGLLAGLAYFAVRELGRRKEHELHVVFWFSLMSATIGLLWMQFSALSQPTLTELALLAGCGLFGTIAQLCMTRSYRQGNTIVSANISYATVIFGAIYGIIFWHETLSTMTVLAIIMVIASGVWISRQKHQPPTAIK